MKANTIYLAGQITPDPKTYEWRTEVIEALKDIPALTVINPCASEFDREGMGAPCDEHGYAVTMAKDLGLDLLPHKDLDHVNTSTIIMFNLWQFDPTRQLIGTLFELAWALERPRIMTIGILRNWQTTLLGKHPFVHRAIHAWVGHHLEAATLVRRYLD